MSKVIKYNHHILSDTAEILWTKARDDELAASEYEEQDIIEETEKTVRELLTKAEQKAKEILSQANTEAVDITDQANQESSAIEKQAYDQGLAAGRKEALEQVELEKTKLLAESKKALEDAKEKQEHYLHQVKDELVELAIQISEKLVAKQLTIDPKTILDIVNQVLADAQPPVQSMVVIQVAPESEQLVREGIQAKLINWPMENLKLETNNQIKPDSCRIITSKGDFELSITDALASIKELLLGADIYE